MQARSISLTLTLTLTLTNPNPNPSPSPSPDPNQVGTGKSYHRDRVTGELHELSPHELVRGRLGLPVGLGLA